MSVEYFLRDKESKDIEKRILLVSVRNLGKNSFGQEILYPDVLWEADPIDVAYKVMDGTHEIVDCTGNPAGILQFMEHLSMDATHYYRILDKDSHYSDILCLCGSTRFYRQFMQIYYEETMSGKIVLMPGFDYRVGPDEHGEKIGIQNILLEDQVGNELGIPNPEKIKRRLDILHMTKISMSNCIYVIDVGGYVGESTKKEIEHATKIECKIRYWSMEKEGAKGGYSSRSE